MLLQLQAEAAVPEAAAFATTTIRESLKKYGLTKNKLLSVLIVGEVVGARIEGRVLSGMSAQSDRFGRS